MIGLDFETYGGVSLPDHGLPRYVDDCTFRPLLASIAWRGPDKIERMTLDFVADPRLSKVMLENQIGHHQVVAHNAGFEQAVLNWLGIDLPSSRFIDSAVVARAAGGGSHLEAAAPQLLNTQKLEEGKNLMRLFSIPGKYQEESGTLEFDPQVVVDHPEDWARYGVYCEIDASLGLQIAESCLHLLSPREMTYQAVTMDMNMTGWHVDIDCVEEMQRRYLENLEVATFNFRLVNDAKDLNLSSLKQMTEWCAERGVKATSFDEKHVARYVSVLEGKLKTPMLDLQKVHGYEQVLQLLYTKQALGGSSLKKLQVILDTAVDGRVLDQYMHCGAGQTLRTTGRSVQMQNLKQIMHPDDMSELDDPGTEWDNEQLARNIRQVFCSSDENGRLIVGDFKSVESRGLAWMAGEAWKVNAYRAGEDVYARLASRMSNVEYADITEQLRKPGKVGELACGYGAAGPAVQAFAEKMGIMMTEGEATRLVWDWRDACPKTVDFWAELNAMLHEVIASKGHSFQTHRLPSDLQLQMYLVETPASLLAQHPGSQSVCMSVTKKQGEAVLLRYFHGCYERGRNIAYYKPSDRKTGDLWRPTFTDQKTGQTRFYELYGGKLAGILTQSLCRELFFEALTKVHHWTQSLENVTLVGQFHDEIDLDWKPGLMSLTEAKRTLAQMMSRSSLAPSFPLAAEIKDDYRYTK